MAITFELDDQRSFYQPDADGQTWYTVRGWPFADAEPCTLSVDVDGHPTIWKGDYPLGTSLDAVTIYRAFAQYLFNRWLES